ncbi:EH signature domain-containing protein [Sphingomonas elodea]|uniref:EH signature domain-containing protein n=1 Tax=Sphingomonas elodea TaxID=179878 RepID=UPI0002631A12|nr:EH signature domain-containing protein [Sphingomonas elodea]
MTPLLARLRERLDAAGTAALRNMPEPDLVALRREATALRSMLGGSGSGAGGSTDRIRDEVLKFRDTGRLADVRSARLVCWGTRLGDRTHAPLIEDGDRFEPLLDEVDAFRSMPRPYRRCWRGLLDGYINYDPDEARDHGARNWRRLREYLNDNLPGLARAGQSPDWLIAVDEHANILSDDPCSRYGAELLGGGSDALEVLRRELSAGDSSWIGRRIFEAQIAAAIGFDDRRFRSVISKVLDIIGAHDLLADEALSRVLDRYSMCESAEIEPALRDASVSRWGNPWLERNDTRWTLVRPETRSMVSSWLKLRLIEDFFSLLSEDGVNDQRRINFWKRYVDQISDMHFALGDAAYRDPRPDFRALRQSMKGRLLELSNGGSPRNNAFIMRIGGHVFVEFGETGNAMFAFDAESLPFDLRKPWVAGNKTALKHPSFAARMTHTDSAGERWERKIERRISELGAKRTTPPLPAQPSTHSGNIRRPAEPDYAPRWRSTPAQTASGDDAGLFAILAAHGIKSVDSRDKGGTFWAYAPRSSAASKELVDRGFAWSDRRGAWYLRR